MTQSWTKAIGLQVRFPLGAKGRADNSYIAKIEQICTWFHERASKAQGKSLACDILHRVEIHLYTIRSEKKNSRKLLLFWLVLGVFEYCNNKVPGVPF